MKTPQQLQKSARCSLASRIKAADPKWIEATKKGASQRSKNPQWIANNVLAVTKLSQDKNWKQAQQEGIQEKTKTQEWKNNQLQGTRTIRANNINWQKNVKAGAQKREDNPEFKILRKELNGNQQNNPKWLEGVRAGMKDRWAKEENLSTCPHCGKKVDNANYKRWHGDKCKLKGF
jgi:hypothetical protein